MGSADHKQAYSKAQEKLITVRTAELKERLNKLYSAIKSGKKGDPGRFDYLWDLKELALMEGRRSVDIPETWLDEMENSTQNQSMQRWGH